MNGQFGELFHVPVRVEGLVAATGELDAQRDVALFELADLFAAVVEPPAELFLGEPESCPVPPQREPERVL